MTSVRPATAILPRTRQFTQRLSNDLAAICQAGVEITDDERRSRERIYDIRRASHLSGEE